jgi:uncharacterized protein YifE (UPF0438 family)
MSSGHRRFLRKRDYEIQSLVDLSGFTSEELAIIRKYGHWMEALEHKTILPSTEAQRDFLEVCYGARKPISEHEIAWKKLKDANVRAIEKSAARLRSEAKAKRDAREQREMDRRAEQQVDVQPSPAEASYWGSPAWVQDTESESPKTWNSCPICGGDGGAKGECFKCSGTGWI